MKKDFDVWKRLSTASGWHCDPVTGQLSNDSIQVWEEELASASNKSLIRRLQNEPLAYCWDLDFIYAGVTATGSQILHPHQIGQLARLPATYNITRDRKTSASGTPSLGISKPLGSSTSIGQRLNGTLETIAVDFGRMIEMDSAVIRAIMEFKMRFKFRDGSFTEDILRGYDLLSLKSKADVFLLLDDVDEQEVWLR